MIADIVQSATVLSGAVVPEVIWFFHEKTIRVDEFLTKTRQFDRQGYPCSVKKKKNQIEVRSARTGRAFCERYLSSTQ